MYTRLTRLEFGFPGEIWPRLDAKTNFSGGVNYSFFVFPLFFLLHFKASGFGVRVDCDICVRFSFYGWRIIYYIYQEGKNNQAAATTKTERDDGIVRSKRRN